MPTLTNADALVNAANDLKAALEGGIPQTNENKAVLDKFVEIFKTNANAYQQETAISQRVLKAAQEQRVRRAAAQYQQREVPVEFPPAQEFQVESPAATPRDIDPLIIEEIEEDVIPSLLQRGKKWIPPRQNPQGNVISQDED